MSKKKEKGQNEAASEPASGQAEAPQAEAPEIETSETDGQAAGQIVSIIYKGDHYQAIIRTPEEEEDFVCDTEYTWNEFDRVSVKISPEHIKMRLTGEVEPL